MVAMAQGSQTAGYSPARTHSGSHASVDGPAGVFAGEQTAGQPAKGTRIDAGFRPRHAVNRSLAGADLNDAREHHIRTVVGQRLCPLNGPATLSPIWLVGDAVPEPLGFSAFVPGLQMEEGSGAPRNP